MGKLLPLYFIKSIFDILYLVFNLLAILMYKPLMSIPYQCFISSDMPNRFFPGPHPNSRTVLEGSKYLANNNISCFP